MSSSRRSVMAGFAALGAGALLAGCHKPWTLDQQDIDMRGKLPDLQFRATDVETGKMVTARDYRGKIVLLYFGYTNCPNVCPLTLYESGRILQALGHQAEDVRCLFVTVDPNRDTSPILRQYVGLYHWLLWRYLLILAMTSASDARRRRWMWRRLRLGLVGLRH